MFCLSDRDRNNHGDNWMTEMMPNVTTMMFTWKQEKGVKASAMSSMSQLWQLQKDIGKKELTDKNTKSLKHKKQGNSKCDTKNT